MDFSILENSVKNGLKSDKSGHDFKHIMRVYKLALEIAKSEKKVDLEVLRASTLLHDIAFSKGFFKGEHGDVSAKLAKPILLKAGFPKSKIPDVLIAIEVHNYWFHNEKNVSIEAKILRDADKLDAIGYNGIIRMILYCINANKSIKQELKDLSKIESKFETKKGKQLAKKRIKIIKDFSANLEKE
jgi:uncharacterized protein